MNARSEREAVEQLLRQADRRLQQFLKDAGRERRQLERLVRLRADEAIRKGAGGLRQRLDDLHSGLENLSDRLASIERRPRTAATSAAEPGRKATSKSAPKAAARRTSAARKTSAGKTARQSPTRRKRAA